MGLMQLMPGTWRAMRALLGLGRDPQDPGDNILAGTAYLRLMYDRFGHPGLFAAYNAGPARYAASRSGAQPLPAETRAYLAAVAPGAPLGPVAPAMLRKPLMSAPPSPGLFAVRAGVHMDAQARGPRLHLPGLFVALGGSLH